MQPSSIPWELIWRIARVAFLAVMAELTREMSPLVVQGDTPVTFGPGFMAGLLGLLSAAEAIYAALKMFGILKTKDVPSVKAKQPLPPGVIEAVAGSYIPAGQMVYVLPAGSMVDSVTSDGRSVVTVRPLGSGLVFGSQPGMQAEQKPPFSGPLHDPKDDTPQAAD